MLARLILVLGAMRPRLKRALPFALHDAAGRSGRGAIRWLERHSSRRALPNWHRVVARETGYAENGERPVVLVARGLSAGGAERQLVNLLRGLSGNGAMPSPVLLDLAQSRDETDAFFAHEFSGSRVAVRTVPSRRASVAHLRSMCGTHETDCLLASLGWAPPDLRADVIGLVSGLLPLRPMAVHGWQDVPGLAAGVAGLAAGVPRVVVSTRNPNPARFDYFRPYMHAVYHRLAREPNVVLTNNSVAGARDYERWLGLRPGRFDVIRNGADDVAPRPAGTVRGQALSDMDLRGRLGLPADAPVVGGIFRLQAEKRPMLWLRAARLVLDRRPEVRFAIFGSGTLEVRMRKQIARLGLGHSLVLAGRTANAFEVLSIFDVLLLTSLHEGTPNVMLEASLMGVPVVATDVGGTAEAMLPGITGLLVPDAGTGDDPEVADDALARRIAEAVLEALSSAALRQSARREGPQFVRKVYGLQRMVAETAALYQYPVPRQV